MALLTDEQINELVNILLEQHGPVLTGDDLLEQIGLLLEDISGFETAPTRAVNQGIRSHPTHLKPEIAGRRDCVQCLGSCRERGCVASLSSKANHFGQIRPGGHTALAAGVDDAGQQRQCTATLLAASAKAELA